MANRTQHIVSFGVLVATLAIGTMAEAKVDPLRVITERMVRAEILLVLDTSGSMAWHPNPAYVTGTDCAGDRKGTVDICGDGMCSGAESPSSRSCPTDCRASSPYAATPGDVPMCNPSRPYVSRMVQLKRVLGNLLPDMRRTAAFGLVTFKQSGYYRYYQAELGQQKERKKSRKNKKNPAATATNSSQKVTVFLSQTEMLRLGAWDSAANRPADSFVRDGVTYTLLSQTSLGVDRDSLYARTEDLSVENRLPWSKAGHLYNDGIHSWTYKGSYYTYDQYAPRVDKVLVSPTYRGPQFVDDRGQVWVYHRYNHEYSGQGVSYGYDGLVVENLTTSDAPNDQDDAMYRLVSRLNTAKTAGSSPGAAPPPPGRSRWPRRTSSSASGAPGPSPVRRPTRRRPAVRATCCC